ncbi:MAG: EscU/YscU/HrcU family type III secretion system export apparatus switch protein [Armatimonadota bacterium]|jgi:flagellar biosynthetic protein FlhB
MDELRDYPATARRRRQLRQRGDVPFSPTLTAAVVLTVLLLAASAYGDHALARLADLMRAALTAEAGADGTWEHVGGQAVEAVLRIALPLAGLVLLACVAAHGVQTGALWAPKRAAPRVSARGMGDVLRQAIGTHALVAAAQGGLVTAGIGTAVYYALRDLLARPDAFAGAAPKEVALAVAGAARELLLAACGVLLVVGGLDLLYQWWRRERRIRMSRREVLQEFRELEAHPAVRRRRSREARLLRRGVADGNARRTR